MSYNQTRHYNNYDNDGDDRDMETENIVKHFRDCFEFIEEAKKQNGNVLVHCQAGVSRSASVVIGYLMHSRKLPYAEAFKLVKEKRGIIAPNSGFVKQLKMFEKNNFLLPGGGDQENNSHQQL
eukprot:GEZU01018032.1.p2 GENE.GEZU01018032.1~~GEZU01018032.1.p2  ORF type:complete len:123 (+),score=39.38 GEZU01018032.1:574-942(+)